MWSATATEWLNVTNITPASRAAAAARTPSRSIRLLPVRESTAVSAQTSSTDRAKYWIYVWAYPTPHSRPSWYFMLTDVKPAQTISTMADAVNADDRGADASDRVQCQVSIAAAAPAS